MKAEVFPIMQTPGMQTPGGYGTQGFGKKSRRCLPHNSLFFLFSGSQLLDK
jgi:hypothetical protein